MSIVFQGVDRCVPGLLCVNFEVVNHRKLQKILRALCSHFFESNDCLNFHEFPHFLLFLCRLRLWQWIGGFSGSKRFSKFRPGVWFVLLVLCTIFSCCPELADQCLCRCLQMRTTSIRLPSASQNVWRSRGTYVYLPNLGTHPGWRDIVFP